MNAKEQNFAYQVKHALDEHIENIPEKTLERLASSRKMALSRKKTSTGALFQASRLLAAGTAGHVFPAPLSWLGRLGVAAPLLAGSLIFIGLYEYEQELRITETAEIDVAVLSDELPISAYADQGFNAYLARREE